MTYTVRQEPFADTYAEIEPLYRAHYAEMTERLEGLGQKVSPYNPRLNEYRDAAAKGYLLTFILRHDGAPVGYMNVYLTSDMHNGDLIAQEDTVYVLKGHRNGVGKQFVKYGLARLRERGVKRLQVSALTDLRVAKMWKRMGFREVAVQMVYDFEAENVQSKSARAA